MKKITEIYLDAFDAYFVCVKTVTKQPLPEFPRMTDEHKRIFAAAYPELSDLIFYEDIEESSSYEEEILPALERYNATCEGGSRMRWYGYDERDELPVSLTAAQKRYIEENKGAFRLVTTVEGDDADEIAAAITQFASGAVKEEFVVFLCKECNKWQFKKVMPRQKASCCGVEIDDADGKRYNDYGKATEYYTAQKNAKTAPTVAFKLRSFYYNKKTFSFVLKDCATLHELLYANFAYGEVFCLEESGRIVFKPNYETYLKGLADNGVRPELYENRRRIISEINSAANAVTDLSGAFYRYFNEYHLSAVDALKWQVGETLYSFETPLAYAQALMRAKETERKNLLGLYNELTCAYFFKGYDARYIELSRMLYDLCGVFVFVNEREYHDFGADFLHSLPRFDGQVALRDAFMQEIALDSAFFDKIKGDYDEFADYPTSRRADYYDRLCAYHFGIFGHRELRYLDLAIEDSERGVRKIRTLVTDAYRRRGEREKTDFAQLKDLLLNTDLCDRLKAVCAYTVKEGGAESFFITTLKELLLSDRELPSEKTYFYCLQLADRKDIDFYYENELATALTHARRAIKQTALGQNGFAAYIESALLKEVLGYILEGEFEKIVRVAEENFDKLLAGIQKLSEGYDAVLQSGRETLASTAPSSHRGRVPNNNVR